MRYGVFIAAVTAAVAFASCGVDVRDRAESEDSQGRSGIRIAADSSKSAETARTTKLKKTASEESSSEQTETTTETTADETTETAETAEPTEGAQFSDIAFDGEYTASADDGTELKLSLTNWTDNRWSFDIVFAMEEENAKCTVDSFIFESEPEGGKLCYDTARFTVVFEESPGELIEMVYYENGTGEFTFNDDGSVLWHSSESGDIYNDVTFYKS